jgi:hypothetical protein
MHDDLVAVARACYRAYAHKDRAAIEAPIADIHLVADGERVFVTYEAQSTDGSAFAIPTYSQFAMEGSSMTQSISAGRSLMRLQRARTSTRLNLDDCYRHNIPPVNVRFGLRT